MDIPTHIDKLCTGMYKKMTARIQQFFLKLFVSI